MAAKDTNDDAKPDDQDAGHSLDMSQAAVKKMIAEAREKGYITYDQLNLCCRRIRYPRNRSKT